MGRGGGSAEAARTHPARPRRRRARAGPVTQRPWGTAPGRAPGLQPRCPASAFMAGAGEREERKERRCQSPARSRRHPSLVRLIALARHLPLPPTPPIHSPSRGEEREAEAGGARSFPPSSSSSLPARHTRAGGGTGRAARGRAGTSRGREAEGGERAPGPVPSRPELCSTRPGGPAAALNPAGKRRQKSSAKAKPRRSRSRAFVPGRC